MPSSGAEVTASAFPRNRDRQIGRPRNDRGCKAGPVAASARTASPKSMRRSRCSFSAIPAIDACRLRCRSKTAAAPNRRDRRRATTQLQPRGGGLGRQNSPRPKSRPRLSNVLPFTGEALNGNVDNTPAPGTPVSLCVLRRCSRASSGATAGWTTGPPYQASPAAEAKLHPRHSGITAGELDEFVEGP